jgi:hypothetical protein
LFSRATLGSYDRKKPEKGASVRELIRTSDQILLSAIKAYLADHDIETLSFDENIGALWSGTFPVRVVVQDEDYSLAKRILNDLGLI